MFKYIIGMSSYFILKSYSDRLTFKNMQKKTMNTPQRIFILINNVITTCVFLPKCNYCAKLHKYFCQSLNHCFLF